MTNILIYEDNKGLATSLSMLLDGIDSLKVLAFFENCNNIENELLKFRPHLVLMDIEMPGIGGIEGLKIAKSLMRDEIKVLMLTVFEDNDKIFDALKFGASGYILKKTPPIKIIEYIMDAIEGGAPMTPSVAKKVLASFSVQTVKEESKFSNILTNREGEVLKLIVEGYSYKMIGSKLFISIDTVRSHIRNIYEKLQVNSKAEAIIKALRK